MARSVPLSRFTPRVGGGSAFFVRQQDAHHAKQTISFWSFLYREQLVRAGVLLVEHFDYEVLWLRQRSPLAADFLRRLYCYRHHRQHCRIDFLRPFVFETLA